MKRTSSLAAIVSGLLAASALSPRTIEAQQSPSRHVQPMEVYVMGKTDTTHVGVGAVPKKGVLAKLDRSSGKNIYLGDARLIDDNGAAVRLQTKEGDRIAFVARSADDEHRLRAPRLNVTYENLTLDGKQVRAAVVDAAELYAQSRGSPVLRMLRGNEGVALTFNMSYTGAPAVARDTRLRTRPDIRIPISKRETPPTPPDTVYVPSPPDTVRVPTPPIVLPPDTVTRTIRPPVSPIHSQLDLGLGYMRERTTTPTLDALFRSWGLVAKYAYSSDKAFAHVDAGTFGTLLFNGKYTETVNGTTTRGEAEKSYLNAIGLMRLGRSPLGLGIGNDFEWFDADSSFANKQEMRNYTSGRLGLLFNNARSYGQVSVGGGLMVVDGSQMNTVTGPAWDVKARAAFMPAPRVELGVHGGYRDYSNLDGATCCDVVTMDGQMYNAGAHLKFPLFGTRNIRPIIGADYTHDKFTGTNDDPRTGWVYWGGLGFNFGREARPETVTYSSRPGNATYVQKDTTRKELGPLMRPAGVTRAYKP